MTTSTQRAFRWIASPGQDESLAAALVSILAIHDFSVAYGDMVAALGLGNLIAACESEPLCNWPSLARDRRLNAVANAYGLTLRPLHPRAAAEGLSESREFGAHFRDSYFPLIARALAAGQIVLNWRGWPPPREPLWGVITERHDDLLAGCSLWHRSEPMPLIGPAHQCYVVEEFRPPAALDASEKFRMARDAALAHWSDESSETGRPGGVLRGEDAWKSWIQEVRSPGARTLDTAPADRQISDGMRVLSAARRTQAAWLREIIPALTNQEADSAQAWADVCITVADVISPWSDLDATSRLCAQNSGNEPICAALTKGFEAEQRGMSALRETLERG